MTLNGVLSLAVAFAATDACADGFSRSAFRNPPADATPAFFWVWNAPLVRERLTADLDEMRAHGVRSVCVHPFPKEFRSGRFPTEMTPDYLTDGYFEVYDAVVHHAEKHGMHLWLYDEGGWPSGGACGRVAAEDHRYLRRYIGYGDSGQEPLAVREQPGNPAEEAEYPSVIEKGVTDRFLSLTHEAYYRKFPEAFGKTIRFAFTDEPAVPYLRANSLRWCADFADVFKAEKGYDILPSVPSLIADPDGKDASLTRVRMDYLEVLAKLFRTRCLLPVRDWCRAHGIASSGHLNGENEPNRSADYTYLSVMDSLRTLDVPGVDVIWRQLFPAAGGQPAMTHPFPRYASSAMHLNGGRYALSECYAIFGESLTPDQMRWLVDYLLVRGINRFLFSAYSQTTAGSWMTSAGPHFGPPSPLWANWAAFAGYVGRMSELLAQGRPGTDVAVFYDTRAFWAGRAEADAAMARQLDVVSALDRRGCDYDFVDDGSLAEATVRDGLLQVGAMRYRTLVLPTSARMGERARTCLAAFRAAGGRIVEGGNADDVPAACELSCAADCLRVMKRIAGAESLYFIANEDVKDHVASVRFREKGVVVRADPESGCFIGVSREPDGRVRVTLPACGSVALIVGAAAEAAEQVPARGEWRDLSEDWTFARRESHVVGRDDFEYVKIAETPTAIALGDWRTRVGETFAGAGVYERVFVSDREGEAELSLGKICWSASVRLNGEELPMKFFGPFTWRIRVAKGRNRLEVTVRNLLANALTDEVRDRVCRDYPHDTVYEHRLRPFDRQNHEGGLFGPVRIRFIEKE